MKKYSPRQERRRHLVGLRRWVKRLERRNKRLRNTSKSLQASSSRAKHVLMAMPEVLSLSRNYEETMGLLEKLKTRAHDTERTDRFFLFDFSLTKEVSLAAMLVFSAEIDRALSLGKVRGKNHFFLRNIKGWDKGIVARLGGYGFFHYFKKPRNLNWKTEDLTDGFAVVQTIACEKYSKERVRTLTEELKSAAEFFDQSPYIYEGLVEAMGNVIDHAYNQSETLVYEAVKGHWWWAAATYMHKEKEVRVAVFDQGVGIPKTLPGSGIWENVTGWLAGLGKTPADILRHDARMIDAAINASRTSRDSAAGHGKGLAEIASITQEIQGSSVRLLSGMGSVLYTSNSPPVLETLSKHIGGTLIEWRVPIATNTAEE